MRILYILSARLPTEKAYGLQVVKTAEAMQLLGHNVELYFPKMSRVSIGEDVNQYYKLKTKLKVSHFHNIFDFLDGLSVKLFFKVLRISFIPGAILHVLRTKPDVTVSREIAICYLLALMGRPVVFEDHEPKLTKHGMYKHFLKKIPKKIVVATNLTGLYKQYGVLPESYIVVPNGVDLENFDSVTADKSIWQKEFGIDKNKKIALYVGHFYSWKGVYTLLDASRKLHDATVVMIGNTEDYEADIISYMQKKDISNVTIAPFMPHHKVIKYIKSADVLVLPNTAQEERSAKYTTPIKLFEYLASHVPIVASNLKSFTAYLKNNVNSKLFRPDDSDDLAKKINSIMNDVEMAGQISNNGYLTVQEFSWEKRALQIISFINIK